YNRTYEKVSNLKFSKNINKLISLEEAKNIDLGLRMHEIFEMIDFSNPDCSSLSDFEKDLILSFLSLNIIREGREFYKEYEFIYEEEAKERHGIIDLLILGADGYSIVDYKLNDITDEEYLKQLRGYQKYIKSITDKTVDIYLYSILGKKLVKLN
ncbi:MAG: hypothetical protein IJ093_00965, partial [Bacilli bacterium]|nr:hypothetical protein [Bacilli bacterium]